MQQLIDFIIPSNRDIKYIQQLLIECQENPEKWMQHHFIVIYDSEDELLKLKGWLTKAREEAQLPHISIILARPGNEGNMNALRQQGIDHGQNPYIYFQDDDDPMPHNIERHLAHMENNETCMATYGICETFNSRGSVVERFPTAVGGSYIVPPLEAAKYFPTYIHPLAALFKRNLFDTIRFDDHRTYRAAGHSSFLCALLNSGLKVEFISDLIRRVHHHESNDNGILSQSKAKALSQDILNWVLHSKEEKHSEFQRDIARRMSAGEITTFRDIAAEVEEELLA